MKIKTKLPEWIYTEAKYNLCLSDDLDSLWSCYYLTKYRNWNIKYFYDFASIYRETNTNNDCGCIGIDMDLTHGKCIGNHVVSNNNPDCINLNKYFGINRINYTRKYAGSTLLMVLSILNVDISEYSDEQKAILLSVDSTFLSYYFNKDLATYYIKDILEYPELISILENYKKQDFIYLQGKYNLKSKIYMDDWGLLETNIKLLELSKLFNINLELSQQDFTLIGNFNIRTGIPDTKNIFSLAWCYRNSARYSYI